MRTEFSDPVLLRVVQGIRQTVDPSFTPAEPGEPPSLCRPRAALDQLRVALVSTAGLHLAGDVPFRSAEDPLGDPSFRVVPRGTQPLELDLAAPYVDPRHIPRDPEVALPLAALERLHARGLVGVPAPRHASFSGGIVRPFPGLDDSARELGAMFADDGVDAVVLIPSCPLCVQTVCLLARALEAQGIPTVCLTLLPELTRIVGAPRSLALRFAFGAPCGDAGNAPLHEAVLEQALQWLVEAEEPGLLRESPLTWRRGPAS